MWELYCDLFSLKQTQSHKHIAAYNLLIPSVAKIDTKPSVMHKKSLIDITGWTRSYRKSVMLFCVSVFGRLRDLQYILAVTSGSPSIFINPSWVIHTTCITFMCFQGSRGVKDFQIYGKRNIPNLICNTNLWNRIDIKALLSQKNRADLSCALKVVI